MKLPTTAKGYLKMLLTIAEDSESFNLKGVDEETMELISNIRADIQNNLGENDNILEKHKLQYNG